MAGACRCLSWLVVIVSCMVGVVRTNSCTVDDDLCLRDKLLMVTYHDAHDVPCDVELTKGMTKDKPTIEIPGGEEGQLYLLLMVDPDANCYLHHIAIGSLHTGNLEAEHDILPYSPPAPPSGSHRYQFFLFKWSNEDYNVTHNSQFKLSEFQSKNGLENPFAVFQINVKADVTTE